MLSVDDVLSRLDKVRQQGDGWIARCPHHRPDNNPSLSVRASASGRPRVKCFAGCTEEDVWRALGVEPHLYVSPAVRPLSGERPIRSTEDIRNWRSTRALYEYQTVDGKPLLLVVRRVEPDGRKAFRQYRSRGPGMWQSGAQGVGLVPYRLPQLACAVQEGRTVYVVEGEKDVLSLVQMGLVATCNVGGAGKWRDEYSAWLEGAEVVILPDNDPAGEQHAEQVASSLSRHDARVRVVSLPGLPAKGDVSDWVAAGGTSAQLEELVEAAAVWVSSNVQALKGDGKQGRRVIVLGGHLAPTSEQAMEAMIAVNDPPFLFQRGSTLVRLEVEEGRHQLVSLTVDALRGEIDRCAEWLRVKENRNGEVTEAPAHPPLDVVRDILALPPQKRAFPLIDAVVRTPIFLSNGELVTRPGYHAAARVLYAPVAGVEMPPVPDRPSAEMVAEACGLILDDLLGDFPFVSGASKAHAVAALLEHPARRLVGGITPLHLFDAPSPGTGKTLLARMVCDVATGGWPTQLTPPAAGSDEWDKRLTSVLIPGPAVVLMDNIDERGLDSPALAAVLTAEHYSGRLLGQSREVHLRNACSWLATGNNVMLSGEVARRTVLCQLDARLVNPEERSGFRHDPLAQWVQTNSGRLSWALCVMVRAWLAAGRPMWQPREDAAIMGSYENWCRVLGGILDVVGVPGFLTNRAETRRRSGYKEQQWQSFFGFWESTFFRRPVSVKELVPLLEQHHLLLGVVKGNDMRALATSLGMALRAQVGRIFVLSREDGGSTQVRLQHEGMDRHTRSPLYCLRSV